jgi:hypothetical protein
MRAYEERRASYFATPAVQLVQVWRAFWDWGMYKSECFACLLAFFKPAEQWYKSATAYQIANRFMLGIHMWTAAHDEVCARRAVQHVHATPQALRASLKQILAETPEMRWRSVLPRPACMAQHHGAQRMRQHTCHVHSWDHHDCRVCTAFLEPTSHKHVFEVLLGL